MSPRRSSAFPRRTPTGSAAMSSASTGASSYRAEPATSMSNDPSLTEVRGDAPRAIGLRFRVIVVGSVNVDLVAHGERLPSPGETVTGAAFSRHHGGKGANQAVAAARLGAPTAFVGALGDDDFGADARAAMAAEGIDLAGLTITPGATGVALILVDARGENLISVASGANAAVTPDLVRTALAA